MRRSVGLAAVVLAVSLVGCSSGDAVTIDLLFGEAAAESVPFRALGAAVDEGSVCASGTMRQGHLESPEGITVTPEEGAALYEAARADEGTMDVYSLQEFACEDGSGTFTMKTHSHGDFAQPETEQDTPAWEVESGTGDYTGLSGSGEVVVNLGASPDEAVAVYTGEVKTG